MELSGGVRGVEPAVVVHACKRGSTINKGLTMNQGYPKLSSEDRVRRFVPRRSRTRYTAVSDMLCRCVVHEAKGVTRSWLDSSLRPPCTR